MPPGPRTSDVQSLERRLKALRAGAEPAVRVPSQLCLPAWLRERRAPTRHNNLPHVDGADVSDDQRKIIVVCAMNLDLSKGDSSA